MNWLKAGLEYDLFWRVTPYEMAQILRGRHAAILDEQDRLRMVAYEQARWLAFAINDPTHMPKFQALAQAREGHALAGAHKGHASAQAAVDEAKVRGWFIKMSMRTKH